MAREIPSKTVKHGLNAEHPKYADDRYVRCNHCGFICHLDRDVHFPRGSHAGDGIAHPTVAAYDASGVTYDGTDDDWDGTVSFDGFRNDFRVDAGCAFCGSYLYDE